MTREETQSYVGLAACDGVAVAPAVILDLAPIEEPIRITIARQDIQREIARFEDAVDATRAQLRALSEQAVSVASSSEGDIFEAHRMVLDDNFFYDSVVSRITSMLVNTEYAVFQVLDEFIAMLTRMGDSYIQERSSDFQDIRRRMLANLSGRPISNGPQIDAPCILVADEISPSETMALPRHWVRGIITRHGSVTSHSAVLARALGVPAVVGASELPMVRTGMLVMLDGYRGRVWIDPTEGVQQRVAAETDSLRAADVQRRQLRDQPAITPDGTQITLMANTDHGSGFENLQATGAEGIGLYRTEYLWLSLGREPTEDEQTEAYSEVVRAAGSFPATIRALDIGGDKDVDGEKAVHHEANPFLGKRSVRYLLKERDVFRRQLRAILRASVHGQVGIMYPMVTTLEELRECRSELEACKAQLAYEGVPFSADIKSGTMIEVPSAAIMAEQLAAETDFFSIGTNDLVQYTMAVDRGNELVADLYQPTHASVLRLIAMTVAAADRQGIPVSVCGEMAGDPALAILLVGLGVRVLSMSSPMLLRIKETIRKVPLAEASALAQEALSGRYGADEVLARSRALVERYLNRA